MIELVCDKNRAFFRETEKLTSGSIGVTINFVFSPEWDGLLKTAVFEAGDVKNDVVLTADSCEIPPDVLACPDKRLFVGVFGELADKTLVIPTIYAAAGTIRPGASPSGMTSAPPSPSWPEQVQAIAFEAKEVADSVRSDADAGKFNGQAGADGGYYTPAVTQPDENTMHVEFTPSKADMPAVDPTDITLPNGSGGGGSGADGKSAYEYAVEGGYTGTEAEFAQKLAAEKFANPQALTFTGAVEGSYDGSEAVTVEIPSGGGIENAQLLVDFTTEADVTSFTVASSDPDTDYRGIIFLLKTISTSSNSAVRAISVGVNADWGSLLNNMSQNVEGRIGYAIGFINLQGNPAFGAVLHTLNGANGIISTSASYSHAPYYNDNEAPCKFKKIVVSTQNSANTMLTGTSIQVWGVK